MKRLAGNVAKSVLTSILGVLFVLVAFDAISALFKEADHVGNNYTFTQALIYVGMTLPSRIYEFIPFASLIGCLVGLGALAGNSELVVMRAAGVSLARIVWFVLRPVLAIIIVGVLMAEYLIPYADQSAAAHKALLRGGKSPSHELWNREGNEFMHVDVVAPGGRLHGLRRFKFDDKGNLVEASYARMATHYGDHWQEQDVAVTRIFDDHTEADKLPFRRWDSDLTPSLASRMSVKRDNEESISIQGLYEYAHYLQEQGQGAGRYWLAFWNKTLQPISVLALVLVAISFIFGPLRQVTMGYRIFSGVVLGMAFWISQKMLGPSSLVFGFSPIIAVLAPVVVCMIIGGLLLRRAA